MSEAVQLLAKENSLPQTTFEESLSLIVAVEVIASGKFQKGKVLRRPGRLPASDSEERVCVSPSFTDPCMRACGFMHAHTHALNARTHAHAHA
jgi:hypothetical protein